MRMTANETIKNLLTKDIASKGMPEKQAKAVMDAIYAAQQDNEVKIELSYMKENMATKADLNNLKGELKTDIVKLEVEINHVKENMATKVDLSDLRSEIKVVTNSIRWIMTLLIAILVVVISPSIKAYFFNK